MRDQWWAGRESNPHSRRRLIYSQRSSPPAQPTHGSGDGSSLCGPVVNPPPWSALGADDGTRTRNRRFTKPLLYQLSYVGAAQGHTADDPSAPGNDTVRAATRSSAHEPVQRPPSVRRRAASLEFRTTRQQVVSGRF